MDRQLIPQDPKNQMYYADAPAPAWGTGSRDGQQIVWVRCPNCRTCPTLQHEISANGEVSPSIWHQCADSGNNDSAQDWHIWGTLLGWPVIAQ